MFLFKNLLAATLKIKKDSIARIAVKSVFDVAVMPMTVANNTKAMNCVAM